ncbi:MAG TPA: hypothetical protein PK876_08775 [Elusimicrobiota bacterium]|nr:hypothetical protein [Elusimicrobiota bacterium]
MNVFSREYKDTPLFWLTGIFLTLYISVHLGLYAYADRMFSIEQDFALNYRLFNGELGPISHMLRHFDMGNVKFIYILLLFKLFGKSLAAIRLMHLPFLLILAAATHDIIHRLTRKPVLSFVGTLLALNMPVVIAYSRSTHLTFLPIAALGLAAMAVYLRDMELIHRRSGLLIGLSMALAVSFHPNAVILYAFLLVFHWATTRPRSHVFHALAVLFSVISVERFFRLSSWGLMHSRRIKSILAFDPTLFTERLFRCIPPSLIYSLLVGLVLLLFLQKHRAPLRDKRLFFVLSSYLVWIVVMFLGQLNTVDPIRLECYVYLWALTVISFTLVIDSLWEDRSLPPLLRRIIPLLLLAVPLQKGVFGSESLQLKPYRTFGLHHRHFLSDDMRPLDGLFHCLDATDGTPGDKTISILQGGLTLYTNGQETVAAPLYHTLNWLTPPCPPEIYQMQAFYSPYKIRWAPLLFDFSFDEAYVQNGYLRDMENARTKETESPSSYDYLFLSVVVQPHALLEKERDYLFRFTDPPADEYRPLILPEQTVLDTIRTSNPGDYERYFKNARFLNKQRMGGNFFLYVFRTSK